MIIIAKCVEAIQHFNYFFCLSDDGSMKMYSSVTGNEICSNDPMPDASWKCSIVFQNMTEVFHCDCVLMCTPTFRF